jgi:hypothetical protein
MSEVTRILTANDQGDPQVVGQLLPLVYDELRRLAALKLAQEKPGHTLQPTALVHEAYPRRPSRAFRHRRRSPGEIRHAGSTLAPAQGRRPGREIAALRRQQHFSTLSQLFWQSRRRSVA